MTINITKNYYFLLFFILNEFEKDVDDDDLL